MGLLLVEFLYFGEVLWQWLVLVFVECVQFFVWFVEVVVVVLFVGIFVWQCWKKFFFEVFCYCVEYFFGGVVVCWIEIDVEFFVVVVLCVVRELVRVYFYVFVVE